jgi:hypothetical protein
LPVADMQNLFFGDVDSVDPDPLFARVARLVRVT